MGLRVVCLILQQGGVELNAEVIVDIWWIRRWEVMGGASGMVVFGRE